MKREALPVLAIAATLAAFFPSVRADEPRTVSQIVADRDRGLIRDLEAYAREHPTAEDREQAYLKIFETAIQNDWFAETEAIAKQYLVANPEGAVRPMAQIVSTMARARAGQYSEAWAIYKELIKSLDGADQEEFATSFADALASEAAGAGESDIARQVYETLLEKFGENPALKQKVQDDLARLDMVGKPAPRWRSRTSTDDPCDSPTTRASTS